MKRSRLLSFALGATAVLGLASSASAQLTIVRNFQGGSPPGNMVGGGDLQTMFNEAADWWERAWCSPNHTVTLNYSWSSLSPGVLGVHTLQAQGGSPNRETRGRIQFDGDGSNVFYADPTPWNNDEFEIYAPLSANLGGGEINTARYYRGATGLANGRIDLYSVILHEIGHSLGLSSANVAFQAERGDGDVDVKAPRPFPGTTIPLTPGSAHLNVFRALMFPSVSPSSRPVIAAVDVLTNAQLSKWQETYYEVPVEASSVISNGSGVNPTGYTEVTPAAIGTTWTTDVDLSNGAALSIVFLGLGGPTQVSTAYGELLCNGPLKTASIAAGVHNSPLPYDCSFVGMTIPTQAATLGPPPIQLQNRIDITVGFEE